GDGRLALPVGRGAPFGRRLLVALERAPLGLLDRFTCRGERVEQRRRVERHAVDQPRRHGGTAKLPQPLGLFTIAIGPELLDELVAPGDELLGALAVELVQALL